MTYSKYQTKVVPLDNHWRLNCLLPYLATITNISTTLDVGTERSRSANPKGERHTTYFGFNSYQEAKIFYQYLTTNCLCTKAIVRRSKRLTSCHFEIKAWGVNTEILVKIINRQSLSLIDCFHQFQQVS
jgi:hypothetical protein